MSFGFGDRDFGMSAALSGLKARGYCPEVVYDVGAADGSWTREAMRYWTTAKYICFEPLDERQQALAALKREYPENIIIQHCGVGDCDSELSFGVTDFLWDSSFAYVGSSSRKVQVHALDTLIRGQQIPLPSFIKIDVQGFEKRVIDGGRLAIESADFVLMECTFIKFCNEMRTLDATISYMSDQDFIPYEFVDFLRRPLDGAMGQCDILFIKRDHSLVSDHRWAG